MAAEKYVGKSVYSCGFNGFGQLPLVSSEMKKKRVVSLPQRCTCVPRHDIFLGSLALGWSCCVICEDKKIEINGFFSEQKTCLQSLPSASDIQSVHYYQGSVYALGSSCHGPLMLKDNMQLKEVKVEFKGHEESKIVTLDGTDDIFYVVSENRHLGKLEQHEASFIYQELFSDMPVEVISCGKEHVMLLTKGGSLYSFGSAVVNLGMV